MYNRRVILFLGLVAAVLAIIVVRLVQLQVFSGQEFREEINRRTWRDDVLPASRGHILDRNGAILAVDEPCFDVCVDYRLLFAWADDLPNDPARQAWRRKVVWWQGQQRKEILSAADLPAGLVDKQQLRELGEQMLRQRVATTWRVVRDLAGSDAALIETVRGIVARVEHLRDVSRHKNPVEQFQSHPVLFGLDEATAVAVKAQVDELVGVSVRPSFVRRYPYEALACHVIGFTGSVGTADQAGGGQAEGGDPYLGDDVIGKTGVERMCEGLLRGRRGHRQVHRITGTVEEETEAQNGSDVHLTIDIGLQEELTRLIPPGASGCIVVLSVPAGEVLAMVSMPGYDLNTYQADFARLAKDDLYFPLRHRAVSQVYAPGSTAKPLAALAGLGSGAIGVDTTFTCTGYFNPADLTKFRCWTVARGMPGHGPMNVVEGLKNSCNVYFYHVGQEVGGARLAEWFGRFGFLDPPGLGLPEERAGLVEPNAGAGESRLMAIGQGPVGATPLHVANAMATIARDGLFRAPVLVLEGGPERPIRQLPLTAAQTGAVKLGMHKVVDESGGTAYRVFHGEEAEPLGIELAGKTGTATVAGLRASSGRQREGDMAWFAGFAPYRDPQIAFVVVLDYVEGGGAANAGPIAREAIRACMRRGYVH